MPVTKRRKINTGIVSDVEREDDRAAVKRSRAPEPGLDRFTSMDRRELTVEDNQERRQNAEGSQRSTPWGFWLVLAAIFMVALVYAVTMLTIGREIQTPATALGAMTAAFAVIGTLVGTYFGIKAGLDGQDKVKDSVDRAVDRAVDKSRERPQGSAERDRDRRREDQPEDQRGPREYRERGREEREEWEGVGV
jgi:hypothetical protein